MQGSLEEGSPGPSATDAEERASPPAPAYLTGLGLIFVIGSAIVGSGLLFVHTTIFDGGLLAGLLGCLLCISGSVLVSEAIYTHPKLPRVVLQEGRLSETTGMLSSAEAETDDVQAAPKRKQAQPQNLSYIDLLRHNHPIFRYLLMFAVALQSSISLVVYVGLMKKWLLLTLTEANVSVVLNAMGQSAQINYADLANAFFVGVVGICIYLSTIRKPSSNKVFPGISCMCVLGLLVLIILLLDMVARYPICSEIHNLTFSYEAFTGLLVGLKPSLLGFLRAMATILFATNSYQNIPAYQTAMKPGRKRDAFIPIVSTEAVVSLVFLALGVGGYFISYFGPNSDFVPKDILTDLGTILAKNLKVQEEKKAVFQFFIWGLRGLMLFVLFSAYLWMTFILRTIFTDIMKRFARLKSVVEWQYLDIAIGVVITALTVVVVLQELDMLFLINVVGAVATSYIMFVVPAVLALTNKVANPSSSVLTNKVRKALAVVLLLSFIFMLLPTGVAVYEGLVNAVSSARQPPAGPSLTLAAGLCPITVTTAWPTGPVTPLAFASG